MIDYKNELNPAQYEAVTTTDGPLLFLAGAGVGKTRTLVYRVSYLLEQGVAPERILLLTFTNKAAREMKERIVSLIGDDGQKITACTYHSFCAMQLRLYGEYVGLSKHFVIIDGKDMEDIISMARTELNIKASRGFPKPAAIAGMASSMINEELSLDGVLEKERYKRFQVFEREISLILAKAKEIKKKDDLVNYDDLMVYFLELLEEHDEIRKKLSILYQYIMIDEYQDTNNIQDKIVLLLRKENHNLVVVGDDHQSLYGFRGANVENIIAFPKRFDDCRTIKLMDNYRSNQEILDVANHVIDTHATEGFKKTLKGQWSSGVKPSLCQVPSTSVQAKKILSLIEQRHQGGLPYHEMAILHRWGFESAELEVMLNTHKIPFVKYGGQKFLERAHIRDMLAYLKIYVNPHDEISWFRILQIHEGIGNAFSRQISSLCRDRGIEGLVDTKYCSRKFYKELVSLYKILEEAMALEWKEFLSKMMDFYIEVKKQDIETMKTSEENKGELLLHLDDVLDDIKVLIDLTGEYKSATTFLDDLNLDATKNSDNDGDAVVISTIHSAKGLEFDTVFIIDCIDELFPSTTVDKMGTKEDNEELRCFYVAITRAKNELWLFVPEVATKFHKLIVGRRSHYIEEADHLFKKICAF